MFLRNVSFPSRTGFTVLASLVLVMLIGLVPVGYAQEVSAGITGSVTDPSQAAIVGATVVATEMDRGTVWTTESNAVGVYAFPRIPPGRYEVRVEAQGFLPWYGRTSGWKSTSAPGWISQWNWALSPKRSK
jgi:hypothetical protein